MKLYANTWCYRDYDRKTAFEGIAKLGFAGVEIIAHQPCWHADTLDHRAIRQETKGLLEELKLEVIALSPSTEYLVFEEDKRRQMVEHTMAMADLTKLYGARIVRIFAGGRVPEGRTWDECVDAVVKCLKPCVDYAEDTGMVLAVESHGQFGTDLKALVTIMEEVKSRALGITLDTSNFAVNNVDPIDAIEAFKDRIYHTHMKDSFISDEHFPTSVGEGSLDFEKILKKLRSVGYEGAYCVEYEGKEAPEKGLGKSKKYLEELFLRIK